MDVVRARMSRRPVRTIYVGVLLLERRGAKCGRHRRRAEERRRVFGVCLVCVAGMAAACMRHALVVSSAAMDGSQSMWCAMQHRCRLHVLQANCAGVQPRQCSAHMHVSRRHTSLTC
jgi:hypothetical protein